MIIGSDSEIMYFFLVSLQKGLAKCTIGVRLIYGFRQRGGFFGAKSGCVLYADATYTRVYTVNTYQMCMYIPVYYY